MRLKSLLFFACMIIVLPALRAQFKRGDKMVGTSIASAFVNSGNSDVSFDGFPGYSSKTSGYGLRIEPTVGWFFTEQTAAGLTLTINPSGEKYRYEDDGTTFQEDKLSVFNIGLGIFARNYFTSTGNFKPFAQAGINGGVSIRRTDGFRYYSSPTDYKETYDGKSTDGLFLNASLQAGMTKMLGENAGLDIFLGYSFSHNKNSMRTVTSTDLDIDGDIDFTSTNEPTVKFNNHNFIIGVGIQIFLRKNSR